MDGLGIGQNETEVRKENIVKVKKDYGPGKIVWKPL